MLCAVYKSSRKAETYLFINKKDHFEDVPAPLLASFGVPQFVLLLALDKRKTLAMADIDKVRQELTDKGYYLQLPPPTENLLKSYRQSKGIDTD